MTTRLTPTQEALLKTAAGCADGAIRWPVSLKGGARKKVLDGLLAAGLAAARKGTVVITDDGMRAIGVEPAPKAARKTGDAKAPRAMRAGSKQARLIEMLKSPGGASIQEIVTEFGWQAHTVRGAIAGALKKKLGLDVTSEKVDGRGTVYRIRD